FSDQIEIHLLELPKFTRPAAELATPLDRWLFFLRQAASLDTDALPEALAVPEIRRAMKELEVISQSDLDRERYEARLKYQRDEISRLQAARDAGMRERLTREVQFLQRFLKQDPTEQKQLDALPTQELLALVERLQQEMLSKP